MIQPQQIWCAPVLCMPTHAQRAMRSDPEPSLKGASPIMCGSACSGPIYTNMADGVAAANKSTQSSRREHVAQPGRGIDVGTHRVMNTLACFRLKLGRLQQNTDSHSGHNKDTDYWAIYCGSLYTTLINGRV